MMQQLDFLVGGPAGTGIESVAKSVALAFVREGLRVHAVSEYANVIRGDHSFSSVHVAGQTPLSHTRRYDLFLAMDARSVAEHAAEMREGGIIVCDAEKEKKIAEIDIPKGVHLLNVPMAALAREAGLALAANVVGVGACFALLERDNGKMRSVLETLFTRKGAEIVAKNHAALRAGMDAVEQNPDAPRLPFSLEGDGTPRALLAGNEAICLGLLKGGLTFLAAYPMTPGSTVMTTLAAEARRYEIAVLHAEDEIAAVNMAVGAAYAGARSATSTSGGGFALMGEAVSLAGQMEVPLLIVNAMRPGPSTGLPTRTAQGDLRMAMHAGQGDFPRIVVAVGDHEEAARLSAKALEMAEEFQVPVILLTEKYLADAYRDVPLDFCADISSERKSIEASPAEDYLRYHTGAKNGVSPRALPGTPLGAHTATSYEHNQKGKGEEDPAAVQEMMEKRWRKLEAIRTQLPPPAEFGPRSAPITLVGWGAMKPLLLAAQQELQKSGTEARVVHFSWLSPLPHGTKEALKTSGKVLLVEGNQSGQLEGYLRECGVLDGDIPALRRFHGRALTGPEIAQWAAKQLEK